MTEVIGLAHQTRDFSASIIMMKMVIRQDIVQRGSGMIGITMKINYLQGKNYTIKKYRR